VEEDKNNPFLKGETKEERKDKEIDSQRGKKLRVAM